MIIAFISQKGGVGKSTLSQAMAVEASKSLNTLLIDCDTQQTTSRIWSERRFANNIFPTVKTLTTDNLSLIQEKSNQHDIIVIDGPAHTSALTIEIARLSDVVIQPSGVTLADLYTSIVEFNTLLQAGVSKDKLFIVLNQIHTEQQEQKARDYLAQSDYNALDFSLPSRVAYCLAQDEGKVITEVNYSGLKDKARSVIKEIIKHLAKHE
jgi:chromosome partitioning protein